MLRRNESAYQIINPKFSGWPWMRESPVDFASYVKFFMLPNTGRCSRGGYLKICGGPVTEVIFGNKNIGADRVAVDKRE